MPTVWIPPLEIKLTAVEVEKIDETIKGMMDRAGEVIPERLRNPAKINNDPVLSVKLDKIIEDGVDGLRPTVNDFTEKLYGRMHIWCDQGMDNDKGCLGMLTMRLMDSIKLVISRTGRYRGAIRGPLVEKEEAKRLLIERGLWKSGK